MADEMAPQRARDANLTGLGAAVVFGDLADDSSSLAWHRKAEEMMARADAEPDATRRALRDALGACYELLALDSLLRSHPERVRTAAILRGSAAALVERAEREGREVPALFRRMAETGETFG